MNKKHFLSLTRKFCLGVASFVFALSSQAQLDSGANSQLAIDLVSCSLVADRSEKLTCYEVLARKSQRLMAEAQKAQSNATAPVAPKEPQAAAAVKPTKSPSKRGTLTKANPVPVEKPAAPTPPSKAAAIPRAPDVVETPVQEPAKPVEPAALAYTLERATENPNGDWIFYFTNGEVWKQNDTRNRRMPKLPAEAVITKGKFGTHRLRVDGRSWSMKIKRLK